MDADPLKKLGDSIGNISHKVGDFVGETLENLGLVPHIDVTGKIFVTGAAGAVGHRAALRLLQIGYPSVRLGTRNPEQLEEFSKKGAEAVDFCWENESTYEKALEGVKTVFCVTPYMEGWAAKFPKFLDACKKAGVQYFVKVSFYHARSRKHGDPFHNVPLVALHGACDGLLMQSSIPCTILSASHFMSNPLVLQGRTLLADDKPAVFYGSSHGKGVNYVSPNDVAEVAVKVLAHPRGHLNKEHTLTGPEPVTDQMVAEMLGKHLGKQVKYVDQPAKEFEEGEKKEGDPGWLVKDLVALEKIKATGLEEDVSFVSRDIERICGRPAETFEAYLQAKEYMSPREVGIKAA